MTLRTFLRAFSAVAVAAVLTACGGGEDVMYKPADQILPQNIKSLAVRPVINKTQQFGLEDKFTLRIRDEFLRDGRYPIVPEDQADGVVVVTITRYILVPTQYDSVLTPTAYKLRVLCDLDFVDRTKNQVLWTEPNLEGIQTYTASTLAGGMTEEQARELVWDTLARDIVKRTIEGFGSVSGSSLRSVSPEAPPHQTTTPQAQPVNPNPY
ncbi:MAG: hypothetical protein KGL53_09835 [Elusimicrobia bacterium]|nr:hypothetical protein [Elusimicrobiota bacterium]